MAYKCCDCGHIFEDGEEAVWYDTHGLERPPYEKMSGCPICKGAYEETVQCDVCGSDHLENELSGGVCDECINEYRKNFNACYELSIGETTPIEINSLLASLFDVCDIEQILKEYIRDRWQDVDCSPFIDKDISWFGERIVEGVKKNENGKN